MTPTKVYKGYTGTQTIIKISVDSTITPSQLIDKKEIIRYDGHMETGDRRRFIGTMCGKNRNPPP